jgi:hypothetical protein
MYYISGIPHSLTILLIASIILGLAIRLLFNQFKHSISSQRLDAQQQIKDQARDLLKQQEKYCKQHRDTHKGVLKAIEQLEKTRVDGMNISGDWPKLEDLDIHGQDEKSVAL